MQRGGSGGKLYLPPGPVRVGLNELLGGRPGHAEAGRPCTMRPTNPLLEYRDHECDLQIERVSRMGWIVLKELPVRSDAPRIFNDFKVAAAIPDGLGLEAETVKLMGEKITDLSHSVKIFCFGAAN